MPAASLPRDGALKLGSEAGYAGEAARGCGTFITQVAYVTRHSTYEMKFNFIIIMHFDNHTHIEFYDRAVATEVKPRSVTARKST